MSMPEIKGSTMSSGDAAASAPPFGCGYDACRICCVDKGGVVAAGLPLLELGVVVHATADDRVILLSPPHGQHPPSPSRRRS
jgi:hypothetical protein